MRSPNQGYAEEARRLLRQYESFSFAEAHRSVVHLFPLPPAAVLDKREAQPVRQTPGVSWVRLAFAKD